MSVARHHAEWLSLVETSGPFLSMPVLLRAFPQGLDRRDSDRAARLREAYEEWLDRKEEPAVHRTWVQHVFRDLLEYPPDLLVEGQAIPPGLEAAQPNWWPFRSRRAVPNSRQVARCPATRALPVPVWKGASGP